MKKFFLFLTLALPLLSCTDGKVGKENMVAEEDSLCIDTIASLDEGTLPDTLVVDTLVFDSI
jgi:hypothetical protein